MSSPAGFDEKTAVFDGKKFGLSVPAPGVDNAFAPTIRASESVQTELKTSTEASSHYGINRGKYEFQTAR